MAAQFTPVSLEDMERFLKRGFRVLRPRKGTQRGEVYLDLSLSDSVAIRVWTSIASGRGMGAGVGQDAIRVQLISKKLNRPLMKGKAPIVKRTQNWRTNLQARIEDYIEAYEDKEEYWEGRAGGETGEPKKDDRPPPPDGVQGPPPSDKQVAYAMTLVRKAPSSFNWGQYGFDRAPDEDGVKLLSRRSVSKMIDALRAAAPDPAVPANPPEERGPSTATFTKLRDGSWGLRGKDLVEGTWTTVIKKSGQKTKMMVGEIVWTGPDGTMVARIGGQNRFAGEEEPGDNSLFGDIPL